MESDYQCPHCGQCLRQGIDAEEECLHRVRHLINHAFAAAVGMELDALGDVDLVEYIDDADTWAGAAPRAKEAIIGVVAPSYGEEMKGCIQLLCDEFCGPDVAKAFEEPAEPDGAVDRMLAWIDRRYPACAEQKT